MQHTFSIILPTYNNLEELKKCIKSLEKLHLQDFEVIISVDGSTDETVDFLNTNNFVFACKTLISIENKGRSSARNLGIKEATGKYILLLDSDMEADVNLLSEHLKVMENESVVSQGFVQYPENDDFGQYAMGRGKGKFDHNVILEKKYLNTGNVAMPTKLAKLVLFDEASSYGEDLLWAFDLDKVVNYQLINNRKAISNSASNVSLEKAMSRYFILGKEFIPLAIKKHPAAEKIFEVHKYSNWIYKLIANQLFFYLARKSYQFFPQKIRLLFIHYLLFCNLKRGIDCVSNLK